MKKKRYLATLISFVVIIATLSIMFVETSREHSERMSMMDLYFFNDTYTSIVSETREIEHQNNEELLTIVLNELIKGPQNVKNKPIIPENAKILSCEQKHSNVRIDFSKEFLRDDSVPAILSVYAIVKSVCGIKNVEKVLVTVEGKKIASKDQTQIGYLGEDDIDLVTDEKTQDSKSLKLYFADKKENILSSEKRTVKITDTNPVEQYIVSELIKGTDSDNKRSLLNKDTVLISASTSNSTCFLNFKSGFIEKNTGDYEKERLIISSIINSLCELDNVDSVVFLVDGKKVDKFGNIDISTKLYETGISDTEN